ncbi:malic enzyme-like NAD(P)-binding protein [Shewanella sp. SR43-8]|uniref:malic enzyme-like NAD(P)-binding protein n=1 Tax=Shewanella sp. SR43-8 TaxID=2760938 RepID=UPI001603B911|nr:malic enzyme-like NAD(P)-binding protein [Shewanella sp. SR43-8]MBB1323247.1 malate dehydrogenase [Shewanella sp. SR43-8]
MSDIRQQALDYHEFPVPGKTAICLTKPAQSSHDLALAYSPGVAEPVREIASNPENAYRYTNKGNTVAVITNGTAILGLGNLGPLASKPVMEGKSLLFKRFANIDSVDIEVKHRTTEDFINTVESIADTFGGINLEDIKAPECFEIEQELIKRCNIPVFHDDQHGTAIVTAAGMLNALEIQGKKIDDAIFVCLGAGAAAIACMTMIVKCGALRENVYMLDRQGVIHTRREDLNEYKALFANNTDKRTLQDVIKDADVFLGLSGADLLTADDIALMAPNPVIFACSNPDPEIQPELAHNIRKDLIMGTGRSDYPNQVNNVLCFPFIFRGALDVRAAVINDEMKLAAVYAIANLAKEPVPVEVLAAYPNVSSLSFGAQYVLPKPMDPRLLPLVARAVSQAAIDSGVAKITTLPTEYKV